MDAQIVVIHPFSGSARKNWPLSCFEAFSANWLAVEWIAGPEEDLRAARRFDDLLELATWHPRCASLCR